jgi:glutathione S-transferase
MRLYYYPGACSLAVNIALREARLPFELVRVDLSKYTVEDGAAFSGINPKNYVPALETDDGDLLTEVAAILQWVGEQSRGTGLLPEPGTRELRRAREWLNYIATELHKGFSPWLFNQDTAQTTRTRVIAKLQIRLSQIEDHLRGDRFALGDAFSVVDAYLFTILNWADGLKVDLSPYPSIRAYFGRVSTQPSVRAAMTSEGLVQAAAA